MKRLKRFKPVCFFIVVMFFWMCVRPYAALADDVQWYGSGQIPVGSAQTPEYKDDTPAPESNQKEGNACGGDPVYLHSGEFYYECTDLTIPGRGLDVTIKHMYQSGLNYNGLYGYGWTINYHQRLKTLRSGNVVIVSGEGRSDEYVNAGNGNYTAPAGFFETLVRNGNGTWTIMKAQGEQWNYDINGNLDSIVDRNGNTISFAYDTISQTESLFPIVGVPRYLIGLATNVIVGYDYRLKTITDTVGRAINFNYNVNGKLDTIVDYAGRTVSFTYDPATGDLLTITKPATAQFPSGVAKTFTYDAGHNVLTVADEKGQVFTTNRYDAQGRVYEQDYGTGTWQFNYSVASQTTVTDRNGFVSIHYFNAAGNPIRIEQFTAAVRVGDADSPPVPASYVTLNNFNADGLITATGYPKGNGVKYTYDSANPNPRARGNLLEVRRMANITAADNNANDIVTAITYEPQFNFPKTMTDALGRVTTFTYDYELPTNDSRYGTKGNLVGIDYPTVTTGTTGTPQVDFTYNANGQVTKAIDANGNTVDYTYFTTTGYLQTVRQDAAGINALTQFTYDTFGNLDLVTDPLNHVTNYDYDALGWLRQVRTPLNFLTKYSHDANGNVIKVERQVNSGATQWQATQFTYDVLNNLKTVTDPLNRVTTYNYDDSENLLSVVDAELNTTSYVYDERDLLYTVTDANLPAGVTKYYYDNNSNLAKIVDAGGNPTNYAYDLFDRLDTTTYADLKFSDFNYDKNSNLAQHVTPSAKSINYVYDELNRVSAKNFPLNASLNTQYVYDLGSRLTDANNAAAQVHYNYDALNRVDNVTQTLGSLAPLTIDYSFDKAGNRTQLVYPSGKALSFTYDANDRLDIMRLNGVNLVDYNYDLLDRTIRRLYMATAPQQRAAYTYDLGNQLSSVSNASLPNIVNISTYAYPSYDNVGNRKQQNRTVKANPLQTTNYTYNDIYELTQTTGAQAHTYDYDGVGNREVADATVYTPNSLNQYSNVGGTNFTYDDNGNLTSDGTNTYVFDEQNRLSQATSPQALATYSYDALNRRVSKAVNGVTTYFIYDGDEVVADYTGAGALAAEYIKGQEIDETLVMDRGANRYYYNHDGLGSVRELVQTSDDIVESYDYDPYGQPSVANSAIGNRYRFTGREYDEETGLYHYRNRAYSPTLGRFLQRDPAGYQDSMNLFSYVNNNPMNYLDPMGLCKKDASNEDEVEELTDEYLEKIYEDTYERMQEKDIFDLMNPLDEANFDTVFYHYKDKIFKYKGEKYTGGEINYIGIGMYEAHRGRSVEHAKRVTRIWKRVMYHQSPSSGTYKWLEEGHKQYRERQARRR